MMTAIRRPHGPRRGVTLVEMLVVVALVVLMMLILVQIFQQATGLMIASRAYQDLDLSLRSLDNRIKQDLQGVTARMTPPLNPADKLGYFEIGENALSDIHGEDSDDYMAFTTKAPEGQVFTGRVFIRNSGNAAVQPVVVTSQLAEVIYFRRNGNLYRRVFLIAPERQSSISGGSALAGTGVNAFHFPALSSALPVSWLGVNDLSAHPVTTGPAGIVVLNDLGSLTNRENRAFRPRIRTDFYTDSSGNQRILPDYIDDDFNFDDIPDFYPTLYPHVFSAVNPVTGLPLINAINSGAMISKGLVGGSAPYDTMAFPYIFPGMYSHPESTGVYSMSTGWIHSLDPSQTTYSTPYTGNHAPLASGDVAALTPNPTVANQTQTWWGFPTWRETLSPNWADPVSGIALVSPPTQTNGLRPFSPANLPSASGLTGNFLPPMNAATRPIPQTPQYANDGFGSTSFSTFVVSAAGTNPGGVWDDDLICTNVRSFDIKVYDPAAPLYSNTTGYFDLGYGVQAQPGLATGTNTSFWDITNQPQGFGHSGRIPPLTTDHRLNPSRPSVGGVANNNFVGDDDPSVIRLNRVWDTWSTDYTNAPDVDIYYNGYPPNAPIYPSYPAPYTSPLRGIQIQIRVNDPRGDYIKTLTIRHDFTDKL